MKWLSIAFLSLALSPDQSDAFVNPNRSGPFVRHLVTSTDSRSSAPRTSWRTASSDKIQTGLAAYPPRKKRGGKGKGKGKNGDANDDASSNDDDYDGNYDPILDEPEGRRGNEQNWIEKSSPIGIGKLIEGGSEQGPADGAQKETDGNYDLGISGASFQTGMLSSRMYDALMSVAMKRFPPGTTELPSELQDVYTRYAMDITAKEAVKAALDQNGLELALDDATGGDADEGMWGDVDTVQLLDSLTGKVERDSAGGDEGYYSLDEAVEEGDWEPGQGFNFVVRNVPARLKEMDISDVLSKLDPDGALRGEAKDKGITLPDEDVASLKDLGKDCDRRTKLAPYETEDDAAVYKGDGTKGYATIQISDLLQESGNADGTENDATLMHVMDALVSHSCLIVDVTDGGTSFADAYKLSNMWNTCSKFFDTIQGDDELIRSLPGMKTAEGAGSPHAVTGFSSYDDRSMQFMETRIVRASDESDNTNERTIVPDEAVKVIDVGGVNDMVSAFDVMYGVGKDICRVAVAAANMEYGAFVGMDDSSDEDTQGGGSDLPFISGLTFDETEIAGIQDEDGDFVVSARLSSAAAATMADELIDDGKFNSRNPDQGGINMSPHRLCRYEGKKKGGDEKYESKSQETFGAHTDTSFLTLVPAAEVSGLEIFDEDANRWLRPELLARQVWEEERRRKGLDPSALTDTVTIFEGGEEREVELPWYSRYVVAMPGELLQIATRNEVGAAVHRVVSVKEGNVRISAPVLLRARSGMRMNLPKYFGNIDTTGSLLKECDGMKMEEIHNALQPSNYR